MHGLELQIEAVRQIRGQSTSQAPEANVSLAVAGPMVHPRQHDPIRFGGHALMSTYYLPAGLPAPKAEPKGLYGPYWDAARHEKLSVQRNPLTGDLPMAAAVDRPRHPNVRPGLGRSGAQKA